MKILTIQVDSGNGFREVARSQRVRRLQLLKQLGESETDASLILLPAGYLCSRETSSLEGLAETASQYVHKSGSSATFAVGIDCWTEKSKKDISCDSEGYPFYVCLITPGSDPVLLRQIATSAGENIAEVLLPMWNKQTRSISLGGKKISFLVCGETWCECLHKKVSEDRPDITLISAHQRTKLNPHPTRSWSNPINRLHRLTRTSIALAEHTRSPYRHKHCWPDKTNVRRYDLKKPDDLLNAFVIEM